MIGVTDMVVATPLPWGPPSSAEVITAPRPALADCRPIVASDRSSQKPPRARHVHEGAVDDKEHHEGGADRKRHAEDPFQRHVHVADDPVQVITLMGNDIREIISEIHVEQESHDDQGEGVVDDAAGDFQQQKDRHDAEEEVQRFRERGTADELVHVDEGVGDGGHTQEGQGQVHPERPAAGSLRIG